MNSSVLKRKDLTRRRDGLFGAVMTALVLLVVFYLVDMNMIRNEAASQRIDDGVMDLSLWNPQQEKLFPLTGQWEFYPDQLLLKEDMERHDSPTYVQVPHIWSEEMRFATYRLQVRQAPAQTLALKVAKTPVAYRIYADNELILENVETEEGAVKSNLGFMPLTAYFAPPSTPHFDLIIHVYGDTYPFGGMWAPIQWGLERDVQSLNQLIVQKESLLIGALLIMGLYYLSFYLVIRKDHLNLWFALGCLLIMLRISLYGERTLFLLIPDLSASSLQLLTHFIDVWAPLPFLLLIYYLFPQESWRWPWRGYLGCAAVYSLLLLILPVDAIILVSNLMYPIVIGSILLCCVTVLRAVIRRRSGAYSHLLGLLAIAVFGIHDMLNARSFVTTQYGELISLGVTFFLIAQAFVLARRYNQAFMETEKLSTELSILNQQKDEFLASTSYELKAPLNGMIGITESLQEGVAGSLNEKQLHHLDLIVHSGRRLNQLIDDLLVYSQYKHNNIKLSPAHLRLDAIVEPIIEIHRHWAGDKPVKVTSSLPKDITVYADEKKLVQILHNLIGNAMKYTSQGDVSITAQHLAEGWVEVIVRDTGAGMTHERQKLIFASFEEIEQALVQEYAGLSLGLPISKVLIDLHGGSIEVDSLPGAGTRIRFTLPAGRSLSVNDSSFIKKAVKRTPSAALSQELLQVQGEREELVVVIDDDRVQLQAIVNFLTLDGYSIVATSDSEKAWKFIEENGHQLSLVILDAMMPLLSGYQLCRLIRERWTEVELPVVMMTAVQQQQAMLAGFEAGANDYLTKPFEAEEFRARVRTLLQMKSTTVKFKEAELAFLQAQIKPHFLYNTLNTIATFCIKNPSQARDLISDFATYLRHSFDFQRFEQLVSIEAEMELVEAYLNIEQARFGQRIDVSYEIAPEMERIYIPQLTIQPLAENAVRHGLMKKNEGGLIRIEVRQDGRFCRISVCDNGAGISDERITSILSAESVVERGMDRDKERSGIGLRNIDARLRRRFGHGLTIEANESQGTRVSFCVPLTTPSFEISDLKGGLLDDQNHIIGR